MQTFILSPDLCYPLYYKALDRQRLGKQRAEAKQILLANLYLESSDKTPFYDRVRKHPVARAWKNHSYHLAIYGKTICFEWQCRGYKDTTFSFFKQVQSGSDNVSHKSDHWWESPEVTKFYQALLYFKSPNLYPQWKSVTPPFGIDLSAKGATTRMLQNVGAIL